MYIVHGICLSELRGIPDIKIEREKYYYMLSSLLLVSSNNILDMHLTVTAHTFIHRLYTHKDLLIYLLLLPFLLLYMFDGSTKAKGELYGVVVVIIGLFFFSSPL